MAKTKKSSAAKPTASSKSKTAIGASAAYDPARGQSAFAALAKDRKAIDPKAFASPSTDIEKAAIAAVGASQIASHPATKARLEALPASEFDPGQITRLENSAWATWYAAQQASTSRGTESKANLPAALVQKATEIEARMQALCEYHFGTDPEIAPKVAFLRPGSGYRDLANDLIGYAEIYAARPAQVATDPLNYRPTDHDEAIATAQEIISLLGKGASKEARARADDLARSWTLLVSVYEDVGPTLRWLFRKDPNALKNIPESLFTAGRSAPKPKASKKTAPKS